MALKQNVQSIRKKINVIEDKLIDSIQTEYADVEKFRKIRIHIISYIPTHMKMAIILFKGLFLRFSIGNVTKYTRPCHL